jgi:predicted metal-dependent hydrolase
MHNRLDAEQHITELAERIWKDARIHWALLGTMPPVFCVIKSNRVAGFAYYSGKVEFNLAYACTLEKLTDFDQTVAHELAHIIQYRLYPKALQAHGIEFRGILARLGYRGDRCHSYSVHKAKASTAKIKGQDILLDL